MSEETTSRDTTETRILITEDRYSKVNVEYQMIFKGTEVVVPFRFSHFLGQMFMAMLIIAFRNYRELLIPTESNSSSGEGKGGKVTKNKKVSKTP